jgi:terminase small subunit-like protein
MAGSRGSSRTPKAPLGLGRAGTALWRRMHQALAPGLRFGVSERETLSRACALADREAELREVLDRDGMMIEGSRGQRVLHPAAGELRLIEAQIVALLQRISVEDTAGELQSPTRQRAQKAAAARWGRERDELAVRRAAGGMDG